MDPKSPAKGEIARLTEKRFQHPKTNVRVIIGCPRISFCGGLVAPFVLFAELAHACANFRFLFQSFLALGREVAHLPGVHSTVPCKVFSRVKISARFYACQIFVSL